jgi:hypothetical protein
LDRFGIADKLQQAERCAGDAHALKHSYILLHDNRSYRINPYSVPTIGWGFDYYVEVLRLLEEKYDLAGLTFFVSNQCPSSLPEYGRSVVLFVLCDESYKYYSYFYDLHSVFKCYTLMPSFVLPSAGIRSRIAAGLQSSMKLWPSFCSRLSARLQARSVLTRFPHVYPLPLGYFAKPNLPDLQVERDIGFLFAGSVEYPTPNTLYIREIMSPPKLASRRLMAETAREYLRLHPGSGLLRLTDGFLGSVSNVEDYWSLLRRAKIVLCPRGGVAETYRFFEAAAAGCVVVSEALPGAWYYDDHPAVIIRNWKRLGGILDRFLGDENRLKEMAARSIHYWNTRIRESVVAEYVVQRLLYE